MANKLTQEKALQILSDGRVHGNRLTRKQKKFFGAVAGGAAPEKAENGIEGTMGGLTDKGFNFNPAWGGAWRNGGWLEKYTDSVPAAQFGLTYLEPNSPKLPRVGPSSELAMSVGGENGEPAYLIPSMKYGRMQVDPLFEFKRTGEHLGGPFKTWQEAEAWERDVRHPYVEKGQSIPAPYRRWGQFAMGGSLPGSVGFTYARVAGAAPSEGPYAKKTLPSAQNGMEMKYYQEGLDWKPKTISKNGGWLDKYNEDVPKAQPGQVLQQRYSIGPMMGDLPAPTQAEVARKDEIRKGAEALRKQREAEAEQLEAMARYEAMPKIGPARERNYSEQVQANEQRRRLNQAYAAENPEVTVNDYGDIVPSGYGRFMQTYGKNLDRLAGGLANTANYIWSTPGKAIQSTYKPGYSLGDALLGKPSNASLLEDFFTDPGTLATLGGKGVLKLAPKMLAPMFAVTKLASPIAEARFAEQLDKVKSMVSSPEAKRAFNQVRDAVSKNQKLASVDLDYQRAMMDESLPEKAIDEIAKSYITADPAQSRLTKEQAEYIRNLSSLSVDMRNIMHFPVEDQVNFLIENSKNIAPRDVFPFLYQTQSLSGTPSLNENQLRKTFSDIINSYGETSVENPLAEYSAVTDLFSLADTFGDTNTSLKSDFARALDALNRRGDIIRPNVSIRPEYYDPALEKHNVREAIHLLARNPYGSIPTPQDRIRSMRESGKQILSSMNRIIQDPINKGVPFVGAHSLSTDSYPITLNLMARNKNAVDFVPIHLGSHSDVLSLNNSMSGLSSFGRVKRNYLGERSKDLMNRLGQTPGIHLPYQDLQSSLIDTRYLNTSIDELNKAAQSNFPAAIFDSGNIKSPVVGIIPKQQDGGEVVRDDRGYWNPDNWGKVVEIDSPYITMKGVDQPLIGVSDTGDVQYMEPGNDYEFDGTSVREYPVAQGGRQVSSRTSGPRIISPSIPTSADSLRVYDAAVAMMNYYANDKRHKKPEINVHDPLIERARVETVGKENLDQYRKMYKDISNPSFDYENSFYKIDYGLPRREMLRRIGRAIDEAKSAPPGVSYYKDAYPSKIDINAPSAVVDYRISPQGFINFRSSVPGYREVGKFLPEPAGSVTGLYYYDPLAIKPYDKRTEKEKAEWEKKYGKPKPKPLVKKETPKTETKKAPVKSVPQTTDQLGMFRNPKVELLVDDFGNYEWFRTDDDIGDLKPIRRATREEIEYSKKQKQRNGGVSVNRADEYPLEKLDNLLNFTNYNKPKAKNGWLEKYK